MKKLFFMIFVVFACMAVTTNKAWARQCNTEEYGIVYVNGMLNSEEDAERGKNQLLRALELEGLLDFNGNKVTVRKAYNPSHIAGVGDTFKVLLQKTVDQAENVSSLDYDAKEMLENLHNEVREGRILFVPHSQGNFYSNMMYEWIAAQKDGLAHEAMSMYNVASPSQIASKGSSYILSKTDKVIAGLVGAVGKTAQPNADFILPKNHIDPLGHNFVDTYLALGGKQMLQDIKTQLSSLEKDKRKYRDEPCIPSPDAGVGHTLLGYYYAITDFSANLAKKAVLKVAGAFSNGKSKAEPTNEEGVATPPSQVALPSKDTPHQKIVLQTKEEGRRAALEAQLLQLQTQLASVAKAEVPQVVSEISHGGSGHSGGGSAISSVGGDGDGVFVASSTESILTATTTATSSAEYTLLGPQPQFAIVDTKDGRQEYQYAYASNHNNPNLMITEYYIGSGDEATWVEITNISTFRDYVIDLSDAEFVENGQSIPFPITTLRPGQAIILRSEGRMIHELAPGNTVVSNTVALRSGKRIDGMFEIYEQPHGFPRTLVHRAHYGGAYCKNPYRFKRSCERFVTMYSGDGSMYWVLAQDPEAITGKSIVSSLGAPNYSWKYRYLNGVNVSYHYSSETLFPGRPYYFKGTVHLSPNEYINLGDARDWRLTQSEEALYASGTPTRIYVENKIYFEYGDTAPRFAVFATSSKGVYWYVYGAIGETASSSASSSLPITSGSGTASTSTTTVPVVPGGDAAGPNASSSVSTTSGGATTTATTTLPAIPEDDDTASTTEESIPEAPRLTADGCYEGTRLTAISLEEMNANCGHGWAPRPAPVLSEENVWMRPPTSGRIKIAEYYIGQGEGEASWVRVSNMTKAQLQLFDTDFKDGEQRIPFPTNGIPGRQYVILKSAGTLPHELPVQSTVGGATTTLFSIEEVLPQKSRTNGAFSFNFAWSPFDEIETLETVSYTAGSCPGVTTEIGSCSLENRLLVHADSGDGYL